MALLNVGGPHSISRRPEQNKKVEKERIRSASVFSLGCQYSPAFGLRLGREFTSLVLPASQAFKPRLELCHLLSGIHSLPSADLEASQPSNLYKPIPYHVSIYCYLYLCL